VLTSQQGGGIGSALIRAALERAKALGSIVFVVGAPDYYKRFGFSTEAAAPFPCPYAGSHFMALPLTGAPPPPSPVVYAPAFEQLA
jgi:putative acetyltransferase